MVTSFSLSLSGDQPALTLDQSCQTTTSPLSSLWWETPLLLRAALALGVSHHHHTHTTHTLTHTFSHPHTLTPSQSNDTVETTPSTSPNSVSHTPDSAHSISRSPSHRNHQFQGAGGQAGSPGLLHPRRWDHQASRRWDRQAQRWQDSGEKRVCASVSHGSVVQC